MPVVLYDTSQLHPGELLGIVRFETRFCAIIDKMPLTIKGGNTMPYVSFDIYAGSDRRLRVFFKDENLDIVNITGATCVFTMRHIKSGPIAVQKSTAVSGQGQIGAADEGECFFFLVPADTSALDICQYVFDVKITLTGGEVYKGTIEGVINLLQPVG